MDIVYLSEENRKLWDCVLADSHEAWFWHSPQWMEYVREYTFTQSPENLSFMVSENSDIKAICPLIKQTTDNGKVFDFTGIGIPFPAVKSIVKDPQKYIEFIFEQIDLLASVHGVKKITLRGSPLSSENLPLMQKFGFIDCSFGTQIINLMLSTIDLERDMRKGHRYDIRQMKEVIENTVYNKDNITKEIYKEYQDLHAKDSGRVTRSQTTFDLMYRGIQEGTAILVSAKHNKENVGFAYHYIFHDGSYYGSAAVDPEYHSMAITHSIINKSIEYLKSTGISKFELGWQFYGTSLHYGVSDKEINIGRFKRGFGGRTETQVVYEKYYDKELFKKEYQDKIDRYYNDFN